MYRWSPRFTWRAIHGGAPPPCQKPSSLPETAGAIRQGSSSQCETGLAYRLEIPSHAHGRSSTQVGASGQHTRSKQCCACVPQSIAMHRAQPYHSTDSNTIDGVDCTTFAPFPSMPGTPGFAWQPLSSLFLGFLLPFDKSPFNAMQVANCASSCTTSRRLNARSHRHLFIDLSHRFPARTPNHTCRFFAGSRVCSRPMHWYADHSANASSQVRESAPLPILLEPSSSCRVMPLSPGCKVVMVKRPPEVPFHGLRNGWSDSQSRYPLCASEQHQQSAKRNWLSEPIPG
jgi:hypothetical protein